MNKALWFVMGMGTGGVSAGTLAAAAVGDLIYEAPAAVQKITPEEAACYGGCAKSDGSWSGAAADLSEVNVRKIKRADTGVSEYFTTVRGTKTGSASEVEAARIASGGDIRVVGAVE